MDRQATLLLALGLLIAASVFVSLSGWILLVRDRRGSRAAGADRPDDDIDAAEPSA
jgi:hypothetical protein